MEIKIITTFIIILILLVLWIPATLLTSNGESNNKPAFIIKSICYWIAIIIACLMGKIW